MDTITSSGGDCAWESGAARVGDSHVGQCVRRPGTFAVHRPGPRPLGSGRRRTQL